MFKKLNVRVSPDPGKKEGCLLCGKPLVYFPRRRVMTCAVCRRQKETLCACEEGHFVCDECHGAGAVPAFLPLLMNSAERDPMKLLEEAMALKSVHLHGPEHHFLVPCVLLTAWRNCGGRLDLADALAEAVKRGRQVPGGTCGYHGACGAAVGAGIFLSILLGASPLTGEVWAQPQALTARCLLRNASLGGPRCCKRTARTAVEEAAAVAAELTGVSMPCAPVPCVYHDRNRECIGRSCPYYPAE